MTATPQKSPALAWETRFLESVKARADRDNGVKATFKRAMSGEPEHIRKVYEFVLPHIGNASDWEQDHIWIPVACLSVYYPQALREPEPQRQLNFGHSCRRLATAANSDGADRRFRALLDLSATDIKLPLTALVRQMKSKGIAIDYAQLLADLRQWEHADQYIQDRWARAFWGATSSDKPTGQEDSGSE